MHSYSPFCKKYPIAKLKIFRFVADDTAKAVSDDDLHGDIRGRRSPWHIVANDVLLIQTVLAVESLVVSRAELLKYDVYKRRRLETRALNASPTFDNISSIDVTESS